MKWGRKNTRNLDFQYFRGSHDAPYFEKWREARPEDLDELNIEDFRVRYTSHLASFIDYKVMYDVMTEISDSLGVRRPVMACGLVSCDMLFWTKQDKFLFTMAYDIKRMREAVDDHYKR